MQVGAVHTSDLKRFGRWDAAFLLLAQRHSAVIDEILDKLDREQMLRLVKLLPFDGDVAKMITSHHRHTRNRDVFQSYLAMQQQPIIAVYCAAAAHFAASKSLQHVYQLKEQEAEELKCIYSALQLAMQQHSTRLYEYMRASSGGSSGQEKTPAEQNSSS